MSGIIVYISHWEGDLSLASAPEDEAMFKSIGPLSLLIQGRTVLFVPDEEGNSPHKIPRLRNGGLGLEYTWAVCPRPSARWRRHPVELEVDDAGDMSLEIPADHLLPWPKIQGSDVGVDRQEVAIREFRLRVLSAHAEGGEEALKELLRRVPESFKYHIPGQAWAEVIQELKT